MKRLLFTLFIATFFVSIVSSQDVTYQLSTHILDISEGKPSPNVKVILEKQNENQDWIKVGEGITNENGRIGDFLRIDRNLPNENTGVYRLTFFTYDYFKSRSVESFYPFVQVVFLIKDDSHYHVPITLSPFGYSTYRGS